MIAMTCGHCGAPLEFQWDQAGAQGPCYRCQGPIQVPALQVACQTCGVCSEFGGGQLGQSGPCRACGATMTVAPPAPPPSAPPLAAPPGPQPVAPGSAHQKALAALQKEASKAGLGIEAYRVLAVGDAVDAQERIGQELGVRFNPFGGEIRTDRLLQARIHAPRPFVLTVPFSGSRALAHELASRFQGTLPASLVLRRGLMGSWGSGYYEGPNGEEDPIALAAMDVPELGEEVAWNWEHGKTVIKLDWGLQAVAVSPTETLHVMQTAKQGILGRSFGLSWYVERQRAFESFLASHGGAANGTVWWAEPESLSARDWL